MKLNFGFHDLRTCGKEDKALDLYKLTKYSLQKLRSQIGPLYSNVQVN